MTSLQGAHVYKTLLEEKYSTSAEDVYKKLKGTSLPTPPTLRQTTLMLEEMCINGIVKKYVSDHSGENMYTIRECPCNRCEEFRNPPKFHSFNIHSRSYDSYTRSTDDYDY